MKRKLVLGLYLSFVGLGLCLSNAAADDAVEGLHPVKALKKAYKQMRSEEGCHFAFEADQTIETHQHSVSLSGLVENPQTVFATEGVELFRYGKKTAAKNAAGRWVEGEDVRGAPRMAVQLCQPPTVLLQDIMRGAKGKEIAYHWEGDAELDGLDCARVVCPMVRKALEKMAETVEEVLESRDDRGDFTPAYVTKGATMVYTIWIGREDLRVYRIELDLQGKIDRHKGALEDPSERDPFTVSYDVVYSRFNEELDFEIPPEVCKLLRIR